MYKSVRPKQLGRWSQVALLWLSYLLHVMYHHLLSIVGKSLVELPELREQGVHWWGLTALFFCPSRTWWRKWWSLTGAWSYCGVLMGWTQALPQPTESLSMPTSWQPRAAWPLPWATYPETVLRWVGACWESKPFLSVILTLAEHFCVTGTMLNAKAPRINKT